MGGGGGALPPTKLAFATPPQTVAVNQCSQPVIIESRTALDQMSAVTLDTPLSITSMPAGTAFFVDSSCSQALSNPRLTAGSSRLTFYFRVPALGPGNVLLTVSALTLAQATQNETVSPTPDGLTLTFNVAAQNAGSCVPATVTATAAGAPVAVPMDTTVTLTALPMGGARFFTDAACVTSPVNGVGIPRTMQSSGFYIRPITGGNVTITAVASFGTTQLTMRVNGAVRRGTCSMGTSALSVNCSINPQQTNVSHTLLVFQSIVGNANEPQAAEVRCRVASVDTITCSRTQAGEPGTIQWQTLELPTNLSVQRFNSTFCPPVPVPLTPAVDPARSFSLSSVSGTGNNYDGDDMTSSRIVDGGSVVFEAGGGMLCQGFDLQVAEWGSGVTVVRGVSPGFVAGDSANNVIGLSAAGPNSVVLAGSNLVGGSVPGSASMCHFFTRGDIDSPTTLAFTRGGTNANCDNYATGQIIWQRIDFGSRARVLPSVVTLPMNTASTTTTLTSAVDMTRSLVFTSGGMAGGQGTGETSYNNSADDEIGDVLATFELISNTQVRVTRAEQFSTALFTMYVVEFEP